MADDTSDSCVLACVVVAGDPCCLFLFENDGAFKRFATNSKEGVVDDVVAVVIGILPRQVGTGGREKALLPIDDETRSTNANQN